MPVQKGKATGLVAKLGQKLIEAHNAAKDKDTDFGNLGDLPAGINGGIAQLEDIKIAIKTKEGEGKGEYYFYAGAIVVTPATFEGMQTAGMRTMITTPLADTPKRNSRKTFAEHWDWMLNELRKLGIDTRTLKPNDVEATLDALRELKPFIRFRTWKGEKQTTGPYAGKEPRVNHEWGGLAEHDGAVDQIGAVADSTGGEQNGHSDVPPDAESAGDVIDWEGLGTAADGDDQAAQTQLTELAEQHGITDAQIAAAANYSELAQTIKAVAEGDSNGDAGEGWKVGDACLYPPKDPKDKSGIKRLKKVQCSILEINADGTVVLLKNLDDPKKKYKDVSVNEIEPA